MTPSPDGAEYRKGNVEYMGSTVSFLGVASTQYKVLREVHSLNALAWCICFEASFVKCAPGSGAKS